MLNIQDFNDSDYLELYLMVVSERTISALTMVGSTIYVDWNVLVLVTVTVLVWRRRMVAATTNDVELAMVTVT